MGNTQRKTKEREISTGCSYQRETSWGWLDLSLALK